MTAFCIFLNYKQSEKKNLYCREKGFVMFFVYGIDVLKWQRNF